MRTTRRLQNWLLSEGCDDSLQVSAFAGNRKAAIVGGKPSIAQNPPGVLRTPFTPPEDFGNVRTMANILKRIPRVLVIQETSVQPGRDKLRGIFNYTHLYGPWHLYLVHGRLGEQKPFSAADCKEYDGIIAGQMMFDLADALKRARKPVVLMDPLADALKPASSFARLSCTLDDSESVGRA
ncbi:MAG: hypothetical protein WC740_05115, partial [Verrucomicrobiia bacterium]